MANDMKAHKGGTKPQIAIYQEIASREEEIVTKLFKLLDSRNESVAVSAAKTLLNKILPDLRSTEISGKDGQPIPITIIAGSGFVPAGVTVNATPAGSDSTPAGAV